MLNLPNAITLTRIALVVVFTAAVSVADRYSWGYLAALVTFILAACTDWLDGYLARRLNQVTTFGKLIARLSQQFGAFSVESEQFNVIVSLNQPHVTAGEQITRENYTRIFSRILSEYKEDGFDRVNPSILKSAVQADYPDFTERQIGLRRFSDVLRALEKEKLLKLETDEGGNMLVHIL